MWDMGGGGKKGVIKNVYVSIKIGNWAIYI